MFWISTIIGVLFAWLVLKKGFFEGWVMLFNTAVSIYLAVFGHPVLAEKIPMAVADPYSTALTILVTAAACFAVLYALEHIFFVSRFRVLMPKLFDKVGSAVFGFLTGMLIFSFLVFLVFITPLSAHKFTGRLGLQNELKQGNISYMCFWCNLVNTVAARPEHKMTCRQAVDKLLRQTQKLTQQNSFFDRPSATSLPTEPNKPQTTPDQNQPGS